MQTVQSAKAPSSEDAVLGGIIVARGDADLDSDYDLMIVVPDTTPAAMRDTGPAYRALWRLGAAVDLLVWTRAEFDSRLHLRASLPSTVQREGKLLYAA